MRSTLVAPDTVGYIWPQVEKFIHAAFKAGIGDDTKESVIAMLGRGEAQLWVAHNGAGIKAAALTRMAVAPNGRRICFCIAVGGEEIDTWKDRLTDIEKWAHKQGCDAVRLSGRPGLKIFKKQGYEEPFVILEKVL